MPASLPFMAFFNRVAKSFLQNRWGRLIAGTITRMGYHDAGDMAASIAYYTFLSVFPLLLGVIAFLGLFLPSEVVQQELFAFFNRVLIPVEIIRENISSVIELRSALGILSLLGLFWVGSAIFGAIGRVVNRAWDIHQYSPFYIRKPRDLFLAIATSLLFFISVALTMVLDFLPIGGLPHGHILLIIVSRILSFLISLLCSF